MVVLTALHLVFNWPIVWRWLKRGPALSAPRATAPGPAGRRGAIGLFGVLVASGAAYFLGLRHGRSDLQVQWPSSAALADPAATADRSAAFTLVERYHAFSSQSRSAVMLRAPGVDWGEAPAAFKRYPDAPRIALPKPGTAPGESFDLAGLAATLWHTAGVSERRGPLQLRTSPSSGALFSTELYVVVRAVVVVRDPPLVVVTPARQRRIAAGLARLATGAGADPLDDGCRHDLPAVEPSAEADHLVIGEERAVEQDAACAGKSSAKRVRHPRAARDVMQRVAAGGQRKAHCLAIFGHAGVARALGKQRNLARHGIGGDGNA